MLIAVPIVARVLATLGIGIISYTSLNLFMQFIIVRITAQIAGMSGAAVHVIAMSGAFSALSIILSALAVRVSLLTLKKFGLIL